MEAIPLFVFLMVIGAATLHATWNFFARKVKGNLAVIYISLFFGALLWLFPTIVFFFKPLFSDSSFPLSSWQGSVVTIGTGLIHTIYFVFLGISYRHGEISVVYPIARGTGVGLTSVVAYIFLGERAGIMGIVGIGTIVAGILAIGLKRELLCNNNKNKVFLELKEISPAADDSASTIDSSTEKTSDSLSAGEADGAEFVDPSKVDKVYQSVEANQTRKNHATSLLCAIVVGVSICMYSTLDKVGVSIVDIDPITYAFFLALFGSVGMTPYMLYYYRDDCIDATRNLKPYIVSVGPLTLLSYTIILFAYREANVSIVVAVREISVVIGAILGFTLLKEKVTLQKVIGIVCILSGLILVKLA